MKTDLEVLTDIIMHISEVGENLEEIITDLKKRSLAHDRTKLTEAEFDAFVETRPKFKKVNYGTPEYRECIEMIKPAVDHHYRNNRHHTKYFPGGFSDMNLIDILEMLADWRAASRRSPDLTLEDSLPIAYEKYGIPENMQKHIESTLRYLGWLG